MVNSGQKNNNMMAQRDVYYIAILIAREDFKMAIYVNQPAQVVIIASNLIWKMEKVKYIISVKSSCTIMNLQL